MVLCSGKKSFAYRLFFVVSFSAKLQSKNCVGRAKNHGIGKKFGTDFLTGFKRLRNAAFASV